MAENEREKRKVAMRYYSRRRYAQNKAAGVCVRCIAPVYKATLYCWPHLLQHRLMMRKFQHSRPWRPGRSGRIPAECLP